MKKLIILMLFLSTLGLSQGIPDNEESVGLSFAYPESGNIFQSGQINPYEADISWKFIVQLVNPYDMRIDIYKMNTAGVYEIVSTQSGYCGTIRATGVGNYELRGYAKGYSTLGDYCEATGRLSPIYVQDTQAPYKQTILQIVNSNNHPKISWNNSSRGLDYQGYKIYKKITEEMGWQFLSSTTTMVAEYVDITETYPKLGGIGTTHPVSYYVTAYDINGNESVPSDILTTYVSGALIEKIKLFGSNSQSKVENYSLRQNYPNPFNPSTVIQYEVKDPGLVKLEVYNILGNKIIDLVNEVKGIGMYNVEFDASNLPSGIYICKFNVNNYTAMQKMSLLK